MAWLLSYPARSVQPVKQEPRHDIPLHQGVPVALEFVTQTDTGEQPPQRRRGANVASLGFATRPGKYRVKSSTDGGKRADTTIEVGTKRGDPVRMVLR